MGVQPALSLSGKEFTLRKDNPWLRAEIEINILEVEVRHDWVLEVLDELRDFARQHHLQELDARLKDAAITAALEIANLDPPVEPSGEILISPRFAGRA